MQFINDSSSESNSTVTFHKNIVSSAVKEEVNTVKSDKRNLKPTTPNNREKRKIDFGKGDFKVPKSAGLPLKQIASKVVPSTSLSLSFLSSLSENTGGFPCHPDASKFKKEYETRREELANKLFALYNKEIFQNQLPPMRIRWGVLSPGVAGFCYLKLFRRDNKILRTSGIVLSTKVLDRAERVRNTLVHEMCHAATWLIDGMVGHGPNWKAWTDRAKGRFPELPKITRYHKYKIRPKYTCTCVTCNYRAH